ncbi:uncharacterized protein LOC111274128 [Durio zibethinus]|uniref:Uncharacterized protein LOC111274128 n=1 Tax=Durio zibethinus TaxID=66656 RepID=A0A6P5WEQ1_DURZI|nr:uncharacterized protein LOC111274128 [Durio zibethinus]
MNDAVEAANKNIKRILEKMIDTYKDWHEKLPFALLTYKTSIRTSIRATPFSLVYGMEAVLPIEVKIPSLRVLMEIKLDEAEWVQNRFEQLNLIEETLNTQLWTNHDNRGKWMPNWESSYVVKKAFSGGALILTEMNRDELPNPVKLEESFSKNERMTPNGRIVTRIKRDDF